MKILEDTDRMLAKIDADISTDLYAKAFEQIDKGLGYQRELSYCDCLYCMNQLLDDIPGSEVMMLVEIIRDMQSRNNSMRFSL